MNFKRFLRVFFLLIAVAALLAGAWFIRRTERNDRAQISNLYAYVEPLQKQRDELVRLRDGLDAEYAPKMRDASTVEILFREIDTMVFSQAYPLMRDRGITGVLGLSRLQCPGHHAKLSVEQYNRLIMDGWGSCFVYDESYLDFDRWYDASEEQLQTVGIALPTAIYFPDGGYSEELNDRLTELGISTVILRAEEGHVVESEQIGEGIWFTAAMPWNYTGVLDDLDSLSVMDSGNLTLTVSFSNMWDSFETENMIKNLNYLQGIVKNTNATASAAPKGSGNAAGSASEKEDALPPALLITDYETASAAHRESQSSRTVIQQELDERKSEIEQQISDLDAQIREIYDRWTNLR